MNDEKIDSLGLGTGDLFVFAIWAGLDALETLSNIQRQPERYGIFSVQCVEQCSESATVARQLLWEVLASAFMTVPFVRHEILVDGRIDAQEMEGIIASIATN
jgi:hypothetical protein